MAKRKVASDIKSTYVETPLRWREKDPDVKKLLGATKPTGTLLIVLFIPNRDRFENEIDHERWVSESLEVLGFAFGGATAYPQSRGVWRDDERSILVYEEPTIVNCYVDPNIVNDRNVAELREFLHRMGRETEQGEIGFVFDEKFYRITDFDK